MSSTGLPSSAVGEPEDPVAAIFFRGGARKINAILRRPPESRARSRVNNFGRITPSQRRRSAATPGSEQQGLNQAPPRRSRRRHQNDARLPSVVNNPQQTPERLSAHEGQQTPQHMEESPIQATHGQYSACNNPARATGTQLAGQEGLPTGPSNAITRMVVNAESGLMRNSGIGPAPIRQLPTNDHFSHFTWQPFHQPMMPSTIAMNMNFPTTLPADYRADLTLTGPNGVPQAYSARWDATFDSSFISVNTAYSLGARPRLYPPGQPTYWNPVGEMTPACFVQNISVNCELLQVRDLQVTLHVVRDIEGGYGIIIGNRMMAMMRQQHMA